MDGLNIAPLAFCSGEFRRTYIPAGSFENYGQADYAVVNIGMLYRHRCRNIYEKARLKNPNRWPRNIRNWVPVEAVYLNPESVGSDSVASHENAGNGGFHGDADSGESRLRVSSERRSSN
jgi:hypothetical protein